MFVSHAPVRWVKGPQGPVGTFSWGWVVPQGQPGPALVQPGGPEKMQGDGRDADSGGIISLRHRCCYRQKAAIAAKNVEAPQVIYHQGPTTNRSAERPGLNRSINRNMVTNRNRLGGPRNDSIHLGSRRGGTDGANPFRSMGKVSVNRPSVTALFRIGRGSHPGYRRDLSFDLDLINPGLGRELPITQETFPSLPTRGRNRLVLAGPGRWRRLVYYSEHVNGMYTAKATGKATIRVECMKTGFQYEVIS